MRSGASQREAWERLHQALGYKPLSRTWAKVEVFLGLLAAGIGQFLGAWAVRAIEEQWLAAVGGLALFVLGGYLALAGHRSHLYQSNNELAAYLVEELGRPRERESA